MVSYGRFRTWFVLGLLGLTYSAPVEVPYGGVPEIDIVRRNETISQEAWIRILLNLWEMNQALQWVTIIKNLCAACDLFRGNRSIWGNSHGVDFR